MSKLVIILLTLATAIVHVSFFVSEPTLRGLIYATNAVGYVTLVALLYLPWPALDPLRRPLRWGLMAFAALTILAYVAFGLVRREWTVPLGPADKLIEVALIALLWREDQASAQ